MPQHLRDPARVFPSRRGMRGERVPRRVEVALGEFGLLERRVPHAMPEVVEGGGGSRRASWGKGIGLNYVSAKSRCCVSAGRRYDLPELLPRPRDWWHPYLGFGIPLVHIVVTSPDRDLAPPHEAPVNVRTDPRIGVIFDRPLNHVLQRPTVPPGLPASACQSLRSLLSRRSSSA